MRMNNLFSVCILAFIYFYACEATCPVRINEFNSHENTGDKNTGEFIELKTTADNQNSVSLSNLILLIITDFDARVNGPSVLMSIDFYRKRTDEGNAYFVIGTEFVRNYNLLFEDDQVGIAKARTKPKYLLGEKRKAHSKTASTQTSLFSFMVQQPSTSSVLNPIDDGGTSTNAILLISIDKNNKDELKSAKKLKLTYYDEISKRTHKTTESKRLEDEDFGKFHNAYLFFVHIVIIF